MPHANLGPFSWAPELLTGTPLLALLCHAWLGRLTFGVYCQEAR